MGRRNRQGSLVFRSYTNLISIPSYVNRGGGEISWQHRVISSCTGKKTSSRFHCLPVNAVRRVLRPETVAIRRRKEEGNLGPSDRLHPHVPKNGLRGTGTYICRRGGTDYPPALRSRGCVGRDRRWTHRIPCLCTPRVKSPKGVSVLRRYCRSTIPSLNVDVWFSKRFGP